MTWPVVQIVGMSSPKSASGLRILYQSYRFVADKYTVNRRSADWPCPKLTFAWAVHGRQPWFLMFAESSLWKIRPRRVGQLMGAVATSHSRPGSDIRSHAGKLPFNLD